ncbi:MAG: DUF1080 domain-containing protein, partial [Marinilabiliales bacterium]|nr:DUF1080 domain-containing protein [Marinilabiliales bacterium]
MKKLFLILFTGLLIMGSKAGFGQPAQAGWIQLFNGKDLTGWKHVGKGDMVVEEGMIHGKGGMGLLYWTGGKFGNCVIRVEFRM